VLRGVGDQGVQVLVDVERQMVQTGCAPLVPVAHQRGGLLDDDVDVAGPPRPPVLPRLERLGAQTGQQPAPRALGAREIGHPELHVVQQT